MTAGARAVCTCAFSDPPSRVWGSVWALAPGGAFATRVGDSDTFAVLGAGLDAAAFSATLEATGPDSDWALGGDGLQLTVSESAEPPEADGDPAGFAQLCRVSGRFGLAGTQYEVSCLGYRAVRELGGPIDGCESIRAVAALFEPSEAIEVLAVRPRRANGHASDAIDAVIIEQDSMVLVDDPRLSTTYADDGHPTRAALELWVGDEQGEHRLIRAAGEALGAHATGSLGELNARVDVFGWHSRGRDGIGAYLLAQRP
ncbi:MAG: hypothetical protein M3018_10420 [Actinomycetota bacterium]|nr:hypothetical protein [Actinomycetota bacterium]